MIGTRGPAPPAPGPGASETTSIGLGDKASATDSQVGGTGSEDEDYEPIDPHPDTPDDFDEDANVKRESEEAIPEEEADDD